MKRQKRSRLHRAVGFLLAFCMVFTLFYACFFRAARVVGTSMEPTLHDEDIVILDVVSAVVGPNRGDIVLCYYPDDTERTYIKRVIGVEGDSIRIEGGRLYRNNEDVTDLYYETGYIERDFSEITVTPGHYFVMGDNVNNSMDSRTVGLISKSDVIGVVAFRLYPAATPFHGDT